MATGAIGIDFGTTNSSIAHVSGSGDVELAHFPQMGGLTDAYRSLLYLEQEREGGVKVTKSWTGPEGIERYLAAETKGRLIQSLKSFLSSRTLHGTEVFGRRVTLEDLIARILRDLREKAELQFGTTIRSAVVGRPVHFVGAEKEADDSYAESPLKSAFQLAGYEAVEFELEPVAAAHYYESTLNHDELILIGDFGGGTSDFSLVRVGPSIRKRGRSPADLLGNAGLGLAGDAFDAKIIKHLVSPALGAGSSIRSMHKILPIPPIDSKSDLPENQTPAMTRSKHDQTAQKALSETVKLANMKAEDFDTVFYVGGHGPMWDLAEYTDSIALIEAFYNSGKPVALVCHSPGALHRVTYKGAPIVKGKRVTGFTNGEEAAVNLTNVVPFLVEDELKRLGGIFEKAPDWEPFSIVDGRLITGQNPASSTGAAQALLKSLAAEKAA